jgi:hypothetical protein
MACRMKNINIEKYGPQPRSEYDMKMLEAYNPNTNDEQRPWHAPPWPGPRTDFDKQTQKKWCPKCSSVEGFSNNYPSPSYPWYAPRTEFDVKLQNFWCSKCAGGNPGNSGHSGPPGYSGYNGNNTYSGYTNYA